MHIDDVKHLKGCSHHAIFLKRVKLYTFVATFKDSNIYPIKCMVLGFESGMRIKHAQNEGRKQFC